MFEVYFSGETGTDTRVLFGGRRVDEVTSNQKIYFLHPQGTKWGRQEQSFPALKVDRQEGGGFFVSMPENFRTWLYSEDDEFLRLFGNPDLELVSKLSGGIVGGIARLADTKVEMGKIGHIRVN